MKPTTYFYSIIIYFVMFIPFGYVHGASNSEGLRRQLAYQPFSEQSIWNTPLGQKAAFLSRDDAMSKMLHSDNVGGKSGSYAWIGYDATSIYYTSYKDPFVKWNYVGRSATAPWPYDTAIQNDSVWLRTPKNVQFFGGTDNVAVIIDPSGKVAYEVWLGKYDALANVYNVQYLVRVDLTSTGIASGESRSEGVRAFGGSILGGLIRCGELESYRISHAVAILVSQNQAKRGAGVDDQKVWPAMNTDGAGKNSYSGLVPIGQLLAIPQSVDISRLDLTPDGLALATALQQFGGYVVDTATNTMSIGAIEHGCKVQSVKNLQHDVRSIRDVLLPVSNNTSKDIGGPGVRVADFPPTIK
ncbi:hypothetical protein [Rhizobium rhododendri]|uniref:Uncharacterized protein n=1 Tax=Rhizobium rhododendri TaxID=2506430 RepID=A0ABY8INA7_9HYPH|nr:hypothetical protein [Rhizobium rhododendri]WFS25212.1 hypothetical protein PR018_23465 [Rhizobium rhododendri]